MNPANPAPVTAPAHYSVVAVNDCYRILDQSGCTIAETYLGGQEDKERAEAIRDALNHIEETKVTLAPPAHGITGLNVAQSIPIEELCRRYNAHAQLVGALEALMIADDAVESANDFEAWADYPKPCLEQIDAHMNAQKLWFSAKELARTALAAARPGPAQPECGVSGSTVDGVKLP